MRTVLRPSGPAPGRRGLRTVIAAAAACASLSVGVTAATAGGGGVTPPDPPQVDDVVCISTCGGVRKATVDSKVQISGRHLDHVSKVLFSAKVGERIGVDPISTESRTVTAKVPDGAATGQPKVTDSYGGSSRSPVAVGSRPPIRLS